MEIKAVKLEIPAEANIIVGQAHFIKTVEDICEIMVNSVPGARFGIAFCEASGPCLIRQDGNDAELRKVAVANAQRIAAGHVFTLVLKGAYPINVLDRVKVCVEVCTIYCATGNAVEVIVAETAQGRGILGVIDGSSPKGVEVEGETAKRKEIIRMLGYKY